MPMITDWLMVGITAIYVAATILICFFNAKSAKATREQVVESKHQFEESKRLETLPFLQVENTFYKGLPLFEIDLDFNDDIGVTRYKLVKLKNLGNGAASNIIYTCKRNDNLHHSSDYPPINAIMQGDSYYFGLKYKAIDTETTDNINIGNLIWQYDDLLGNSYEQDVSLIYDKGDIRFENDPPKYLGIVKYEIADKEERHKDKRNK